MPEPTTVEALEARMAELAAQRDEVVTELKEVTRQRDLVYETEIATAEVANMGDARKTALLQAMGIESTSNIGAASKR